MAFLLVMHAIAFTPHHSPAIRPRSSWTSCPPAVCDCGARQVWFGVNSGAANALRAARPAGCLRLPHATSLSLRTAATRPHARHPSGPPSAPLPGPCARALCLVVPPRVAQIKHQQVAKVAFYQDEPSSRSSSTACSAPSRSSRRPSPTSSATSATPTSTSTSRCCSSTRCRRWCPSRAPSRDAGDADDIRGARPRPMVLFAWGMMLESLTQWVDDAGKGFELTVAEWTKGGAAGAARGSDRRGGAAERSRCSSRTSSSSSSSSSTTFLPPSTTTSATKPDDDLRP